MVFKHATLVMVVDNDLYRQLHL